MFDVRPRKIFKDTETEIWSMEYNYGDGFAAEDVLAIHLRANSAVAWLVVKDESHKSVKKYAACARAVIRDTDIYDGCVEMYTLVNHQAAKLSPKDLIMWIQENPSSRQEINNLFYEGDDPVFLRLRNGWSDPILPEAKEKILNFSQELCTAINSGNFDKEDLLLIFRILSDLSNYPEYIEARELMNDLFKSITCSLGNTLDY